MSTHSVSRPGQDMCPQGPGHWPRLNGGPRSPEGTPRETKPTGISGVGRRLCAHAPTPRAPPQANAPFLLWVQLTPSSGVPPSSHAWPSFRRAPPLLKPGF